MPKRILFLIFITLAISSCVTRKEITYFQPKTETSDLEKSDVKEKFIIKLQPGDILNIRVSSLSPEANLMFNVFPETQAPIQNQTTQTTMPAAAVGFLVDTDGKITLPLAGKIMVGGMSTEEAADLITKSLEKYLQQPTVNVRIINFKISVLGEVMRPSVYTVSNERITIPEAISLAGDLSIYGKRENILIIREVDGKREFARVDLTQRDLFNSPYYYLRPNDIVYVEPSKGKITSTDRAVQLAPIVISALTFLTLISANLFNILK